MDCKKTELQRSGLTEWFLTVLKDPETSPGEMFNKLEECIKTCPEDFANPIHYNNAEETSGGSSRELKGSLVLTRKRLNLA